MESIIQIKTQSQPLKEENKNPLIPGNISRSCKLPRLPGQTTRTPLLEMTLQASQRSITLVTYFFPSKRSVTHASSSQDSPHL